MFDAFGIHFRNAFGNAKATEERYNSFMADFAGGCERSPFLS